MARKNHTNLHIVYLVAHIEDISGGTRVIVEHVNRLKERGHRVEIWTMNIYDKPYFSCNVPVKVLDTNKLARPDVVVVTDPVFVPDACTRRTKGSTFLLLQHDNDWVLRTDLGDKAAAKIGFLKEKRKYFNDGRCEIMVVSPWLQAIVKEKYGLESHVIDNGINNQLFYPDIPILKTSDPIALVLYDPQIWKGFNEAAQAVLQVQNKLPRLRIAIIGSFFPKGPQQAGVNHGLSFPAVFFNRPLQTDLAKIYSSASVFVTTSWQEGFGLPGLEAMACGVPVVTTDSGGNREFAINEETALIVPQQDIAATAESILRILTDSRLNKRLRSNGLATAQKYNWNKSIDKLEAILQAKTHER